MTNQSVYKTILREVEDFEDRVSEMSPKKIDASSDELSDELDELGDKIDSFSDAEELSASEVKELKNYLSRIDDCLDVDIDDDDEDDDEDDDN